MRSNERITESLVEEAEHAVNLTRMRIEEMRIELRDAEYRLASLRALAALGGK
jgi:hypothetical protein